MKLETLIRALAIDAQRVSTSDMLLGGPAALRNVRSAFVWTVEAKFSQEKVAGVKCANIFGASRLAKVSGSLNNDATKAVAPDTRSGAMYAPAISTAMLRKDASDAGTTDSC